MIRMMIAAVVIRLRKNCVELLQKCWRTMGECDIHPVESLARRNTYPIY